MDLIIFHTNVCMYGWMYVCLYVCMYGYVSECVFVCMFVRDCVCVYVQMKYVVHKILYLDTSLSFIVIDQNQKLIPLSHPGLWTS